MTPSTATTHKKRKGRKRKAPLPPGPSLPFVVGNHPNDFRNDSIMRRVRSHVMYKHREQQGASSSRRLKSEEASRPSAIIERTPTPRTAISDSIIGDDDAFSTTPTGLQDTVWEQPLYDLELGIEDPTRHLILRIISATTGMPTRSAPPILEDDAGFPFPTSYTLGSDSLTQLKHYYIGNSGFFCHDMTWMQYVCSDRLCLLSHVSLACVYQDIAEGLLYDTALTINARREAMRCLQDHRETDDFTILAITHLLLSKIGSSDDGMLNVHYTTLNRIISERGGILSCPIPLTTFISLALLIYSILRRAPELTILRGFMPRQIRSTSSEYTGPVSPLYAPRGDFSSLADSCSMDTMEVLADMYKLTHTYITRCTLAINPDPRISAQVAVHDARIQRIYARLLVLTSVEQDVLPDWTYESCRIAALIYTGSIVHSRPLSISAGAIHASSSSSTSTPTTTLLSALHTALQHTNTQTSWGPTLRNVFLWICLIGGAASCPSPSHAHLTTGLLDDEDDLNFMPDQAWARKCFAMYAVRAALATGFEFGEAGVLGLRVMGRVVELLDGGLEHVSVDVSVVV